MDKKKTALITGASKRIGKTLSLFLARKDWNIALHYNNSEKDALELKKEIEYYNVNCEIYKANLEILGAGKKLIQEVYENHSTLNLLINNASVFEKSPIINIDEKTFDKHFNVNFKVPFFMIREYLSLIHI